MDTKSRDKHSRIGFPRGLLRHLSFQFLSEKPMSGSEIVDKIEEFTDWRPSPGSIYPLLSHMQETGIIKVHKDEDPSLKRFKITESGRRHAEEFLAHGKHMRSRNLNIRKMYWRLHTGISEELYESLGVLLDSLEDVYKRHSEDEAVSDRLKAALDSAVSEIKGIDS
jgi:DNA-binding PadR family transcriptional regulator